MFKRLNLCALTSIGLFVALGAASDALAQCSGGRGGGGGPPMTSSPSSFNSIVSSSTPNPFAYQQALMQQSQMYAMQQLMMQQQAQMYAMQQQLMQQNEKEQYAKLQDQVEQRQELVALRTERAEQKRTQRAEKIAALKAKREAENSDTSAAPSTVMFSSKQVPAPISTEFVAKNPFAIHYAQDQTK